MYIYIRIRYVYDPTLPNRHPSKSNEARTARSPGEADGDYCALEDDGLEGKANEEVDQGGDVEGEDAVAQDAEALEEGAMVVVVVGGFYYGLVGWVDG